MKRFFQLYFSALALVFLSATAIAAGSPSGWQVSKAGPYVPTGGGAELRGRSIIGLGETALTEVCVCAPAITSVNVNPYDLVELSGITYTAMSITRVAEATQNVTRVVGVVMLSPTAGSLAAGGVVQVSRPGSIVHVRVAQPVSVTYGDLLVSTATAGELTVTANASVTVTASIVNFQALESKVTASGDQFVIARQLR